MARFLIKGGKPLKGKVRVVGNKNSTFPLIAASLIVDGPVVLTNVPVIRDVSIMAQILEKLGARVEGVGTDTLKIDARKLSSWELDPELSGKLRGSVVLAAPLLVRFGRVKLPLPGGDSIGERLLDTHFEILSSFGAGIKNLDGSYELVAKKISPNSIFLYEPSVTATEMALIMAACHPRKITIEDAAAEPHVQDLAEFLTKAGAKIAGSGTNTLQIEGSQELRGITHRLRDDHIEAAIFAIASAITGGEIVIEGANKADLKMTLAYLSHMGVSYRLKNTSLEIFPSELVATRKTFKTRPWPGFPTDLMSSFIVLATQTRGTVLCHDWMYEWRIFFVDHLIKMGANITIADPHRVIVSGPTKLHGEIIPSPDIRAGSALVLAALCARGESIVEHAEIIERGYEDLDGRLRKLGAKITRVE